MTRHLLPSGWPRHSGEQGHAARVRSTLALAALFTATLSWPAAGDPYRLGVQDKLRVKVVDWRAGKGEYYEWEVISAEYTVNPTGAISLPLVGEVQAEGRTTEELAACISDQLQKRVGPTIGKPLTAVEIVTFRPVYVLGHVEHPGEYTFRPGLTVMQAVGIAGGFYRMTDIGLLRLERDRIAAVGEYEAARIGLRRALVRRARLEAERNGADTIETPEELNGDPNAASLVAEEAAIVQARSQQLKLQINALNDLKALFEQEVRSLADKTASQNQEIDLARRELKSYGVLSAKGLAVSSRDFLLQRTIVELEGKLLDIEAASLRAKEEKRKSEQQAADLQQARSTAIIAELNETEASIDQFTAKLATARALISEAAITAPRLALERSNNAARAPSYTISRSINARTVQIPVEETTPVEPGDAVRVEAMPPREVAGSDLTADGVVRPGWGSKWPASMNERDESDAR
jgi:exopolysaccharide production protein ExoF